MRSALHICALGVAASAAACGPAAPLGEPAASPRESVAAEAAPTSERSPRCDEVIPFEPTYLPEGFGHQVYPGAFPGGRPPDDQSSIGGSPGEEQVIVHYRGWGSRAIEIRRPGSLFVELAQSNDAPTIEVLRSETTGFAPTEPGGDDFIVQFSYPPHPRPHEWCARYSLNGYGVVPLEELKKVAEALRPTD